MASILDFYDLLVLFEIEVKSKHRGVWMLHCKPTLCPLHSQQRLYHVLLLGPLMTYLFQRFQDSSS